MNLDRLSEQDKPKAHKPEATEQEPQHLPADPHPDVAGMVSLQQSIGNTAVQRLLAQRSEEGPSELDDQTAQNINRERGGGQALDTNVQAKMGDSMGHDFSGVKVHTSPESDTLNRQLGAKAFTTGSDIFFRGGAYDPHTSGGQELIAHELTHVVQQSGGGMDQGGKMTVNAPGETAEQEADSVSKDVMSQGGGADVQRAEEDEMEDDQVQKQEAGEEEEDQIQKQEADEEEEDPNQIQKQEADEEEDQVA